MLCVDPCVYGVCERDNCACVRACGRVCNFLGHWLKGYGWVLGDVSHMHIRAYGKRTNTRRKTKEKGRMVCM